MMHDQFLRFAIRLCPILVVVGCASASHRSAWHLENRLQTRLAPQIAAGQVGVQRLPDGVRVTLSEQSLFPYGSAQLDDRGRYLLASVVQGLLDPRLLRVDVSEQSGTSTFLQQQRVRAVTEFIHHVEVAPELLFAALATGMSAGPVASAPQPMAITVTVGPIPQTYPMPQT